MTLPAFKTSAAYARLVTGANSRSRIPYADGGLGMRYLLDDVAVALEAYDALLRQLEELEAASLVRQ